jgi:hypothetical protein
MTGGGIASRSKKGRLASEVLKKGRTQEGNPEI